MEGKRVLSAFLMVSILLSGCMGTYETARVARFRAGATYFGAADPEDDETWSMPGIFLEAGLPAGASRFGLGLHIKAAASIGEDDGFIAVWGAKLQLPENGLVDIAVGMDAWGILPGEIKLHLSRRLGAFEPYLCAAAVDFLDYDDDDSSIDLFSGDGIFSMTLGTMIEIGEGSGWKLAAEVEAGEVWEAPGFGAGIFREF